MDGRFDLTGLDIIGSPSKGPVSPNTFVVLLWSQAQEWCKCAGAGTLLNSKFEINFLPRNQITRDPGQ